MYFDRQGNEVALEQWARGYGDGDSRRVAASIVEGKWISTVFLGLNHQYGDGPPLIFETMVFPSKDAMGELHCERYSTEAQAAEGHKRVVEMVKNGEI